MTIKKEIVLVDDSVHEAEFVRRAVAQRFPDVELRVFRRGAGALAYLAGDGPATVGVGVAQVVLLDLKLPGVGGHQVLRELRALYPPGELPVVIFSSSREPADLAEAYRLGANSYVVKPMVHEEYVQVVGLVARYWLDVNTVQLEESGAGHE